MHFVPHFVDNAFFAAASARLRSEQPALRKKRGITPDASVLLFAGKFIPVKRPLDFVRGVAALAHRVPGVEGAMVGEGPMRAEIEAEIERTGAPVRLLGFFNQSEMPEALRPRRRPRAAL